MLSDLMMKKVDVTFVIVGTDYYIPIEEYLDHTWVHILHTGHERVISRFLKYLCNKEEFKDYQLEAIVNVFYIDGSLSTRKHLNLCCYCK